MIVKKIVNTLLVIIVVIAAVGTVIQRPEESGRLLGDVVTGIVSIADSIATFGASFVQTL